MLYFKYFFLIIFTSIHLPPFFSLSSTSKITNNSNNLNDIWKEKSLADEKELTAKNKWNVLYVVSNEKVQCRDKVRQKSVA